jgi:ribonuclease P protein component
MLPSKQRLSRLEFNNLLSQKDLGVVFNNIGTLKFKKAPKNQFSVVISSKNEKSAVLRNKLRRRIYEIFTKQIRALSGSYALILYSSKKATTMEYKEIENLLNELIKKATK